MKKITVYFVFSLFLAVPLLVTGQVDSPADTRPAELSVRLAASVEPGHVPMNRPVTLTVQVSWKGDLNRIDIEEVDEPLLSHLEITGTASANHILGGDKPHAVREIVYTLSPTTLGMAYVESVVLRYNDTVTGETHVLRTERIGVEVLPPVREKTAGGFPYWILIGPVLLAGGGIALLIRRMRSKKQAAPEAPAVPVETSYLEALKNEVLLKDGDRNQAYSILSKLCRRYLAERYRIPAMEATTASMIDALSETELDDKFIMKLQKLFEEADVIKFSGQEAGQPALESAYTTFESLLEHNLAEISRDAGKN